MYELDNTGKKQIGSVRLLCLVIWNALIDLVVTCLAYRLKDRL